MTERPPDSSVLGCALLCFAFVAGVVVGILAA